MNFHKYLDNSRNSLDGPLNKFSDLMDEFKAINSKGNFEVEEIGISKIEEVDLQQSILGRILGYGSISISGTGSGHILLKDIDAPLLFQKNLNDLRFNNSIS